jgi:6-phosphofructokinase 1
MVKAAAARPLVKVVDDEILTPTSTQEIARNTWELIQTEAYNLYHMTAQEAVSWYAFARVIFDELNLKTPLESCSASEFPSPVKRPLFSALENGNLKKQNLDGMIVIGGNGTFTGAGVFIKEFDFPIMGTPGTIDNDLYGTDMTIGYDTALNTVMDAVDKIRDTADSHSRLFFIEVMGRDAGFIALRSGIAGGAEDILVPETVTYIDELIETLETGFRKNKRSGVIIVAEGNDAGGAFEVARKVKEKYSHYDTRVTVLGHIQRGGSPSSFDRILASTLGYEAVNALISGRRGEMVGIINRQVVFTPFEKSVKHHKEINRDLLEMARILSS